LVVPLALAAARDDVPALAAAGRELAFSAFVLVLLAARAVRRAGAAAGFLVCLAGVAAARALRVATLLAAGIGKLIGGGRNNRAGAV